VLLPPHSKQGFALPVITAQYVEISASDVLKRIVYNCGPAQQQQKPKTRNWQEAKSEICCSQQRRRRLRRRID
jgi:hypothetical protein